MPSKKTTFSQDEEPVFDNAIIYKRGEYWHFRMWLSDERKYARFSLKTRSKSTALDKAKLHYHELMAGALAGRRYFSVTTKLGVEMYLEHRAKEIGVPGGIVKGRYATIKTHLEHWLDVVGRDTKLKELERTDCEDYFFERTKTKKKLTISQTTVANEQATINALIKWLYKRGETYIDSFDFKKLARVDTGDESNRRNTFSDDEVKRIVLALDEYIKEAEANIEHEGNTVKAITGYYLGVSLISGLRRGEQLQLRWDDISDMEHKIATKSKFDLVKIVVRAETSKVRKTRKFVVKDEQKYFAGMLKLAIKLSKEKISEKLAVENFANKLLFSQNGLTSITPRAIGYHFDRLIDRAGVKVGKRDLVPYSFRHYFITKRVNSNLPAASIAEMCGTSITQIEKTYYHTTEEKMVSNALADYEYRDGMLVPL